MAQLSPVLKQATPVVAARGEGALLFDKDGRRYLDFTAGIGVTSTGHCHPAVVEAVRQQVGKLIHGQYTTVLHEPMLQLVDRLGDVLPTGLDSVFFANSGSEAIEAAMRLARQATGRPNIVVFHGSFHGRTVGAASLTTSGNRFRAGFSPLMGGVVVSPFPTAFRYGWSEDEATRFCLQELDYVLATLSAPADTAAFFVEPMLGEGGYVPATRRFMEGLRQRADEHGIVLVVDEVQTGFGRTGKYWGHEHFDVMPDITVLAKGLASGFPLSAIAAPLSLMGRAWPGSQGGTYGANAVSCAAAVATLDVIEREGLVTNADARGKQLRQGLEEVASGHSVIGEVRGMGLMQACEFVAQDGSADPAMAEAARLGAAERGLLLLPCGALGNAVRFIPALVVDETLVNEAVEVWRTAVEAAEQGNSWG